MKEQLSPTKASAPRPSVPTTTRPQHQPSSFGRSLLDIPLHHDATAASLAAASGARAVTLESGVYFGAGSYRPDTASGRELIAHEAVHVAQQQVGRAWGPDAERAAETEASALAPAIARTGWAGIHVTRPAVAMMRDKIPDADLSQDRDAIRATLRTRFPWLSMLSNRVEIEDQFVERIVYARRAKADQIELDKLPDPRATYLSDEIDRRTRRRAPFERRLHRDLVERDRHGLNVKIELAELFSPQLAQNPTGSAGIAAAVQEIKKHQGWVHLDNNGLDSFRYGMWIQIDGEPIPIERDGLHLSAFFADPYLNYATIEIQRVYWAAHAEQLDQLLQQYADIPSVASENLKRYVEQADEAALPAKHALTADERMIKDYGDANRAYAESIRSKTEAAMVPLIFIAGFFEIDGPVDLMLAVFPVDKLGAKLIGLGKEAIKARKARKLEQALIKEFEGHADAEIKAFIGLAKDMKPSQVRALKEINKHIEKNPALIKTLMERSLANSADLKWIAKQLENKTIDANFVRSFTHSEAGPSWQAFKDIVENKIGKNERAGFANQIKGVLGEQAAAKLAKTEAFATSALGGTKGSAIDTLITEVKYGTSSIDLVATTDTAKLVFGEVKHYAADTWPSMRRDLYDQLDRHNAGIPQIATDMSRRQSDIAAKILFVSEDGFKGMSKAMQIEVSREVTSRGWTIQFIADKNIETLGQLIDRVRK